MRPLQLFACTVTLAASLSAVTIAHAAPPDRYEPDNSAGSAKSLALTKDVSQPGAMVHTFTSSSDVDWVKFSVASPGEHQLIIYNLSTENPDHWIKARLYRLSGGKWVAYTGEYTISGAETDRVEHNLRYKGTYALRLRPYRATATTHPDCYYVRLQRGHASPTRDGAGEPADDKMATAPVLPVWGSQFSFSQFWDNHTYRYNIVFGHSALRAMYNPSGTVDDDWYRLDMPDPSKDYYMVLYEGYYGLWASDWAVFSPDGTLLKKYSPEELYPYTVQEMSQFGSAVYLRLRGQEGGPGHRPYWYRIGLFAQ